MDIFEFNFEIFDTPIFSLTISDDIFFDDEIEEPFFDDEIEEPLPQPEPIPSVLDFIPTETDSGVTLDRLQTLARSNRPDVARAARLAIEDIEIEAMMQDVSIAQLDTMTFPTPTIIEDIGGVEVPRRIGQGMDEELKESARQALRSGGGGGGGGSSFGGSEPSDYGGADESELEVYLDEWESDDWQLLRSGSSVEDILIEKWENANNQDWYEYLRERDELDDGDF